MRTPLHGSIVLLVAIAAILLQPWAGGHGGRGNGPRAATVAVTRVIDGDTIEVQLGGAQEDVRLIGVDTPETVKPDTPVQCFGPQASHFTKNLLEGKRVR